MRRSRRWCARGCRDEALFFELALEDLSRAADLFLPVYKRTAGVDGFVSLEVSPLLAYDTQATIAEAKRLHAKAGKPNLFIKIPGTREGLPAIEAATFAGVPVNVTLLFSTRRLSRGCRGLHARPGATRRSRARAPTCARSPRCSSAAGTARSSRRCRTN